MRSGVRFLWLTPLHRITTQSARFTSHVLGVGRSGVGRSRFPEINLLPFTQTDRMAAQLKQLQTKATLASQFLTKHGTTYYKQLLEQNKQYIQEPATVEKCSELSKQLFYTRLASLPTRNEAFWKEYAHVKELWKNKKDLNVEQVGVAALFGLECFAWFCAGEIVGRGFTFTGYYV